MIDPRTPISDEERLAYEFKAIKDRLDTLEAPTGTSIYQTVSKLQALVDDIQAQLDAWAAGRRTDAQTDTVIDQKIAAAIAAVLAGNVTIGGSLQVNGGATVNGTVTVPGARNTQLSTAPNRVTAWIAGDGRLGHTA